MGDQEKPSHINAIISAFIATLSAFSVGTAVGWSSPAGVILEKEQHMSSDAIGWVVSIIVIGSTIGTLPAGFMVDIIGRKLTILVLCPPFVCGWCFVSFAGGSVIQTCVGRFILGLCSGAFCIVTPIFNTEIAHPSIRGSLGVLFNLQYTSGILFAYVLGFIDHMRAISLICAIFPIILFILMFVYVKETPISYVAKQEDEQAMKSLMFYRGTQYKYLDKELNEIKGYTNDLLKLKENKQGSFFKKFLTKYTLRAFGIGIGLQVLQQLSAINMIIYNVEKIFSSITLSMSARIPPVIFGTVIVLSTILTTMIIDKFRRRTLMMLSLLTTGTCNIIIGICFKMEEKTAGKLGDVWPWILVITVCVYTIGFAPGIGAMLVMTVEMFAPEVKGPAVSLITCFNGLFAFISVKCFLPVVHLIGMADVFWICGVSCYLGIIFIYFVCVETQGKTLKEIQQILGHSSE